MEKKTTLGAAKLLLVKVPVGTVGAIGMSLRWTADELLRFEPFQKLDADTIMDLFKGEGQFHQSVMDWGSDIVRGNSGREVLTVDEQKLVDDAIIKLMTDDPKLSKIMASKQAYDSLITIILAARVANAAS